MAQVKSGSFSTSNYSGRYLLFTWSATQNVEGNYSDISWLLKGAGTASASYYMAGNFKVTINSETVYTSATRIQLYDGTVVASGTKRINHSSDGNMSFSAYAEAGIYSVAVNKSGSGSWEVTTIPRASGVTCNSFYIGDSTTINISRASSNFTHTLTYNFGSLNGTIVTKTALTSVGWTPPTTFYGQMPNGRTGYGSVTCQTYSGNTLIGTKSTSFNAYAKDSDCIPDVSATIIDTNLSSITLTGDSSKIIKYISNPKVTLTATAKNSAGISSRRITCEDGQSSNAAEYTFSNGVSSDLFKVIATDSRAYSKTVSYDLSTLNKWIEYIQLAFSGISLTRPESTASTASLVINGKYFNGSFGSVNNTLSLKYRYKEDGGSFGSYTDLTPTITNNTFSYSSTINEIDYQKQYVFEFVAEDEAMQVTSGQYKLEKGEAIFRLGHDYTKTNGRILDNLGTEIVNGLAKYKTGGVDIDPNITLEELILTETNRPRSGGFWYIRTMFYGTKSTTTNRTQIAYPYAYDTNIKANTYIRTYVNGIGWSAWALTGTRIESGWVSITPSAANVPTAVRVNFKNTYVKAPNVVTNAGTGAIGTNVLGTSTNGVTTTYANIVLTRSNTVATTVYYTVMEGD